MCFDFTIMVPEIKVQTFPLLEVMFLQLFFGKVWGNLGKILRTPKNLPAPAPMFKAMGFQGLH